MPTRTTRATRHGAPLPKGITRTGSGAYRARRTTGTRRSATFATQAEARRFLREQEGMAATVGEVMALWMSTDRPAVVRATTLERDQQIIRNLPEWFTTLGLGDVSFSEVSRVVNDYPGRTNTKKRVLITLKAFFTWCVRKEFLPESPAAQVTKIVAKTPAVQPNAFSWAEVDALADEVRPTHPYIADALVLSAHTGLRAGELRALRVGDFYTNNPGERLVVSRSHTETQKYETATKSGQPRLVGLDIPALEIVRRLSEGRDRDEYMLTTTRGCQVAIRNMQREMDWKHRAPGHRWHDLRHTAAVEWVKRDIAVPDIQLLLGHASLATTQRYLASLAGTPRQQEILARLRAF